MAAELVIRPGEQYANQADFLASEPPYTIGVEAVSARPQIIRTDQGPYMIADHHTDVERRVTAAACLQAWEAVGLGLVPLFTDGSGEYRPRILVNDCDQDVILTRRVLEIAENVPHLNNHEVDRIDELVRTESTLDTFGGVPPGRITPRLRRIMESIAWIFDPYSEYRASGALYLKNANSHREVMDESSQRIDRYIAGRGRSRRLDTRYQTLGKVEQCVVAERIGAEALLGVCSDGAQAAILWQARPDGRHQYTYYQRSEMAGFSLRGLYQTLNQIENCPPGQGHGGSNNMGGSQLKTGSGIPPDEMMRILAGNPQLFVYNTPGTPPQP